LRVINIDMSTVAADDAGLLKLMGRDLNRIAPDTDHSRKPFQGWRQRLMVAQVTGAARDWRNEASAASIRVAPGRCRCGAASFRERFAGERPKHVVIHAAVATLSPEL
jgi:hypothetical protein